MATLVELSTDQLTGDCKRTSIAEFPAYISVLLAHNGCFTWGLKRATAKTWKEKIGTDSNHKLVCYDIPFFSAFSTPLLFWASSMKIHFGFAEIFRQGSSRAVSFLTTFSKGT